jgi:hypothetical protein
MSVLNVNGWTTQNELLRMGIIDHLDSDIVCLTETHLAIPGCYESTNYLDHIQVDNYAWFGNNRKHINARAPKPSGGVGVLIKHTLLETYDIKVVDREKDGILALVFTDKQTLHSFVCVCTYLTPENSVWGRDASSFYNHLLQLVYMYSDVDAFFMLGDLNSRIGSKVDFNADFDSIVDRVPIDLTKNLHGEALIEFLLNSKMCVLNG